MLHKYNHNISAFTNNDSVSYYLLGAYITDGCVFANGTGSFAAEIKSKDKDWILLIRDIVSTNMMPKKIKNSSCYRLRIINKQIASWLINNNCVPRKSLIVRLPQIPDMYFSDFIRGCMDGDGSIGQYYRRNGTSSKQYKQAACYIVSASKSFIVELDKQCKKHGLQGRINVRRIKGKTMSIINGKKIIAKHDQYLLRFTGQNCKSFLQFCYYEHNPISMPRKQKIAEAICTA